MKYIHIGIVTSFLLLIFGCSPNYRPFTEDLQNSYQWSEDDLKHIQFYLSNDIILRRELSKGESVIEGGRIVLEEGRRVEEIIFEEGTPGVLVFMPKSNRMAVSFEEGDDKFLMFGPHPKQNDRYMLLGSEWNRRTGQITYQGKKYRTPSASAYAGLLVDLNRVTKISRSRHRASGRRI